MTPNDFRSSVDPVGLLSGEQETVAITETNSHNRSLPVREGCMLKVVVMLFLAYSIVGCATHVAASNRGGSVTESVHVKF